MISIFRCLPSTSSRQPGAAWSLLASKRALTDFESHFRLILRFTFCFAYCRSFIEFLSASSLPRPIKSDLTADLAQGYASFLEIASEKQSQYLVSEL
ncbi:hypothetical protein CCHR01_16357 [Colletotrichum chrysophilum]|uniref:Uncharacterized protein n=1 Tax=Colletotrichum chrysophilum TaxID=1836956 RepID=A0AAD9A402_9PEZI|nr:hypothetical protein K456DRAFT_965614 [Colletotrichum gloeosporioides 23]KAK1841013.1 hypothetical protein CCHR01_16357 [Colletotrichum chrysophilum]